MKKSLVFVITIMIVGGVFAQSLLGNRLGNRSPRTAALNAANASSQASGTTAVSSTSSQKTSDPGASKVDVGGRSIEFNGAALDIVLMVYGNLVGKTVLKDPQVPAASITLQPKQGQELSDEDKILAIETVLEMNGIHLEPYGEKFVRALPRSNVRKDGIPLLMDPDTELGESSKVVSVMLAFHNIALDEAQKALEGLKSDKGVLNVFERTSSILVTDTEMNINRMREIVKSIDVPTPVTENVFVRQIKNASAQDIKAAIEAIVQESQKELEKSGQKASQTQANNRMATPNSANRNLLNRPNGPNAAPAPSLANESLVTSVSDADRGMIRGKVLILSDERSNKLIIVTSKSNMDFFDKVIDQLDIETTPDTVIKVYRLKYADSEDVSDMINDLIGNAASSKNSTKGSQNANSKNATTTKVNTTTGTSSAKASVNQRTGEAKPGELSKENTTVLCDKRINGLVVMTNKELVPVIEQIIEAMDIKLSQVLIETCIIEVTLSDEISTGIDWVHKIGTTKGGLTSAASGGGGGTSSAASLASIAKDGATAGAFPAQSGANFLALSDKIDLGAVIEASKTDGKTKYLASPVIMTLDNKEAIINATKMQYLLKGFTSSGNSYSTIAVPDYEQKELGIEIKVTPKINPNGTVMLQVEEKYSQQSGSQNIKYATGNSSSSSSSGSSVLQDVTVPLTVTREMSSDVILENHQTVVFGGLTETFVSQEETGIPILKDIPWVGRYLFGKTSDKETRNELLVFMTPYVLDDGEAAQLKAKQLKNSLSDSRPWEDGGWSESKLADPVSQKEKLRRQKEDWEKADEERANELAIEQAKLERARELNERVAEEKVEKDDEPENNGSGILEQLEGEASE